MSNAARIYHYIIKAPANEQAHLNLWIPFPPPQPTSPFFSDTISACNVHNFENVCSLQHYMALPPLLLACPGICTVLEKISLCIGKLLYDTDLAIGQKMRAVNLACI